VDEVLVMSISLKEGSFRVDDQGECTKRAKSAAHAQIHTPAGSTGVEQKAQTGGFSRVFRLNPLRDELKKNCSTVSALRARTAGGLTKPVRHHQFDDDLTKMVRRRRQVTHWMPQGP
jgi:hypothetical protein